MKCVSLLPADHERLHDFYASLSETITGTFRPFEQPTLAVLRRHLQETEAGRHVSIGLESSGKIVGHGFVMNIGEKHPVFGLGLDESLQGQGWGRRLMETVLENAREMGVEHMTLTVVKRNRRALRLYRSFGFKAVAEYTFKEENDSFLMCYNEAR